MDWLQHPSLALVLKELHEHRIYKLLNSPKAIQVFMEHHVWCVWDFQSLLKAMQRHFTCVEIPWRPSPQPLFRRLINEIVLGEESDEDGQGGYLSHFELYLKAMKEAHADTGPIEKFLGLLRDGTEVEKALQLSAAPPAVIPFVRHTIQLASKAPIHKVASAFTLGREDLLPGLFQKILEQVSQREQVSYTILEYYLNRHIELDSNTHGPQAFALLDATCGNDGAKVDEAVCTARECLEQRLNLWNAVAKQIA
ncbi:MAG: DUF3050 domain-containing protein [Gemmataceae bacterium]|jgi:hypothetical protein